tara:strand:+ start:593 stop:976 length:384 start_codon:yes stop_codon:yes gene_type:complete
VDWASTLISQFEDELEDVYEINPPIGWRPLVESLLEYIKWQNKIHKTRVKIYSIEKRHGGLRIVVHHSPASSSSISGEIFGAIHLAETLSCKMCEQCGAPGNFEKLRSADSLILGTYCNEHLPQEKD